MPISSPRSICTCFCALLVAWPVAGAAGQVEPHAAAVVEYLPGENPAPGYDDPTVTLGPPNRCTSYGVVSPFNPQFEPTEIVSIGRGGSLTVAFDQPVTDDPKNPFGIDLVVFSNAGFIDTVFPNGVVGGLIADGGQIEVSVDGAVWVPVPGVPAEGLFPTMGYVDAGPYDYDCGSVFTIFTRPVNPELTLDDLNGLSQPDLAMLYGGSGGGTGVDLSPLGLQSISFVRIVNPEGAPFNIEIDAFADVAPAVIGDVNGDGVVDVSDLIQVINRWGAMVNPADVNDDGTVDVLDLILVILNWTNAGATQ